MLRLALVSDLHGNALALEAVLADAERAGIDRLVCLGDVATLGPRPEAVIARLKDDGCDCIVGNHDAFLLEPELIRRYTEASVVVESVDWCRDRLSDGEREFLAGFRSEVEIDVDDDTKLLLFHGSPRSHMEDLLATTPPQDLDVALDGRRATVLAGGHTHIQMLRQHKGMLLVNPGSVGAPFEEYVGGRAPVILPHAEYGIVTAGAGDVRVDLRRVVLDKAELRAQLADTTLPLRDDLLAQYA